jgi:acetyltransferase
MRSLPSNINLKKYESLLKLKNGKKIFLRPIMDSDRHLLVDLFSRMSPQSIYLRFLRRLDALPKNMINRLLTIDYHTNFALVAVANENKADGIISVARYGNDPDEDGTELAVAVRDDWQHAGLGKIMLSHVINIAKDNGITNFTGIMDPQNSAIQKLLGKLGYEVKYSMESGFYQVEITT